MDLDTAWARLDSRFQLCLHEAWTSLCHRGLPVGAVIATDAQVLARGRNRVYDPPGGSDPLQGTPLAHAEMNAMASVARETDMAGCSIWSTHTPCSMCAAAIEFAELASVHSLASDPSDEFADSPVTPDPETGVWEVVANLMFLHNVAWVAGEDNPIVERNARAEPEITTLALRALEARSFIDVATAGGDILSGLSPIWHDVVEANNSRSAS